ncbi:MAG: serine/threonine protein kinase [Alphaproteobacteria bacterium]|nr:serine/threonine protein kinase [Alphaproteobacteria bacterium]
MDLAPGTVVERYTVDGVLGRGGMAVVYRVHHNQLGSPHAMKVLTLPTPSVRKRLLQEGRVQSTLRHPNIVAVTDVVDLDGSPALVMEYVRGPSLSDFLSACRPTRKQADALADGILAGVQAAHAAGLVHRDLKPGNVLLSTAGGVPVPKITDFGLAKLLDDDSDTATRTRSGVAMGTPAYMAPEQIRDSRTVDHRADLWSLGAILYELVTGERAFVGADTMELFQAVCAAQFVPVRERLPKAPARMVKAIEAALTVPLADRAPDCATLRALWTGTGADDWSGARGIWDQQTLFQVEAISQVESASAPPAEPSQVGTFLFTTHMERRTEQVGDQTFEIRRVEPGVAALAEGREARVTRAFLTAIEPVSKGLVGQVRGEEPDGAGPYAGASWDEAVALCNALSEATGCPPAYALGEWRLRKALHLDEIGRLLYDLLHFDRIPAVLARFGTDTLHVLQFEPERLAEIDGIGPKTAQRIGLAWDRTLVFTRDVTSTGAPGWRLPTEAELVLLGAGPDWEWTCDGDDGPAWSDVASDLPVVLPDDRWVVQGRRRVVRRAGERRALKPETRDPGVRFRVVRTDAP